MCHKCVSLLHKWSKTNFFNNEQKNIKNVIDSIKSPPNTNFTYSWIPTTGITDPNVFTPNGDGENDKFYIKGIGVSSYYLKIFSRWGELIFESNNLEDQWDGTYNGEPVSNGTYVYSINYKSMVDKDYNVNGTVTVIRWITQ